jgi:undecaprenyl diphosphate synthase
MNKQEFLDLSDDKLLSLIKNGDIPRHVAIIMDGNGRWATLRKMPRTMGHRKGMDTLTDVIRTSCEVGIRYLTLFAFSTENWKRPAYEVNALMALMTEYIDRFIDELNDNNIKITVLGDIDPLSQALKKKVSEALGLTFNNNGLRLNIALNYGSRSEILNAVKKAAEDICLGKISADDLDEAGFARYLYTKDMPDPDFIIRTGGELRLSNFLLYQAAYSELFFTSSDLLWPDFNKGNFLNSILEYQHRNRRYGEIYTEQGS